MASLHSRAVDVNLVERGRIGQVGNLRAFELERDIRIGRRNLAEIVGAHGRLDHREQRARHAIVSNIVDRSKLFEERGLEFRNCLRGCLAVGIKARSEKVDEDACEPGIEEHRAAHREASGRELHLERRGEIGADEGDLAP